MKALLRIGFVIKRQKGSHVQLTHPERGEYTFAFHDNEQIGPAMMSKIGKKTGLSPEDL